MANYNPLGRQNENALSNYPFHLAQEIKEIIVDAKFVQFDAFIPILDNIVITSDRLELTVIFDYGKNTDIILLKDNYLMGEPYKAVRIYTSDKSRYLGMLTFGAGVLELWKSYVGRKLSYSSAFLPETTASIPSNDAVYTFDGNHGEVQLSRTAADTTVFYNTSLDLNSITLNAVGGHTIPEDSKKEGLRKINLVTPLHNNINLASNDVIKIKSFNSSSLTIELVSGSPAKAFTIPTLIA